jgi:hypothetical protein
VACRQYHSVKLGLEMREELDSIGLMNVWKSQQERNFSEMSKTGKERW